MPHLSISRIFWSVVLVGLISWSIPNYPYIKTIVYSSPCETPLTYRIDTVDPRFKISKEKFAQHLEKAEVIWEKNSPYNLFQNTPGGEISVNLVFDERQNLTNQINQLDNNLEIGQEDLQAQESEYNKLAASFRQKLDAFNKEVAYYNSEGGAPFSEYERLLKEQEELKSEGAKLDELAKKLNKTVSAFNQQVGNLNKTIDNLTTTLEKKPEEGIYIGSEKRIEIYFNVTESELVHTIAHEIGHALGINHNENERSIMYPFTTRELALSKDDQEALDKVCKKLTIFDRLKNNLEFLTNKYVRQESRSFAPQTSALR